MKKHIIGIYSPLPGSGKGEVAKVLARVGYSVIPFATDLKEVCADLAARITGMDLEEARSYMYVRKNEQIPGLPDGITGRFVQQQYGTDFVRKKIDPDAWVKAWSIRADSEKFNICADDVRFENEADAIESRGGELWLVTRPSLVPDESANHESEGKLNYRNFALHIVNDGTIEDIWIKVMVYLAQTLVK